MTAKKKAARGLSALFDRIAENRPNSLIARFRRWRGGKLSVEDLERLAGVAEDVAKKAKRK
jgi:hypothetical protein